MQRNEILYREATIKQAGIDKKARTAELSFSSETPVYKREMGAWTVLDHSAGAANLSILPGSSLLLDHNGGQVVGVIDSARVTNRRGNAIVRFSKSALGEEVFQDVCDGIRRQVSVGATVEDYTQGEDNADGMPTYRITRWTPREISLCGIPADPTVGIGRSISTTQNMEPVLDPPQPARRAAAPEIITVENALVADRARGAEIEALRDIVLKRDNLNFGPEAKLAIQQGWTADQFGAYIAKSDRMKSRGDVIGGGAEDLRGPHNRSIGDVVASNDLFRNAMTNGGLGKNALTINIPDRNSFISRGDMTSSGLSSIDKRPDVKMLGVQQPSIGQLCQGFGTNNSSIRYIQEVSITNAADMVAEGAAKPEASFDLTEQNAAVRKVATYGRFSDELLMDYTQVASYVNNRLQWMVNLKEDTQLLQGDGTGQNLLGILNVGAIQTEARGGDTQADAIFKAIVKIQSIGFFQPDAIVMHPLNWQTIRLSKDAMGQYYGIGPLAVVNTADGGTYKLPSLWELPVIRTTAATQGTALVGAFSMCAEVYRRMGLVVEMSNSEGSNFVENMTSIRAETRLTITIPLPLGFCQVTGL